MTIEQFAEKYHIRTHEDECGDTAIFGELWEQQPGHSRMYGNQIYEHGGQFALLLMFPVDGGSGKSAKWVHARKKLINAGFTVKQDGDAEGVALFDPHEKAQARLALKLAGMRTRQISAERKAALTAQLTAARMQKARIGNAVRP